MKIFNPKTQKIHEIESVEVIDNKKYIFTTDIFCFPENEIEYFQKSFISHSILKIINKEKLTTFEESEMCKELKKFKFVEFDYDSHKKQINKLIKKKKYGFWSFLF